MKHLKEMNMSYLQHMIRALCISSILFLASACCFVHAFIPCLFDSTATTLISTIKESAK